MGDSYFGYIRHFIKEALITWGVELGHCQNALKVSVKVMKTERQNRNNPNML
jgi:hypothetical protein